MPPLHSEYAKIAGELAGNETSDAYLRSAVNRYYYAALTAVRAAYNLKPNPTQGHSEAVGVLNTNLRGEFGGRLSRLHNLRVDADYYPDKKVRWDHHVVTAHRTYEAIVAEMRRRGHFN